MKIETSFFCDDVRQEFNGKFIFIGAYGGDILLNTFPSNMTLYIVICARFAATGAQDIEVEARIKDRTLLKGKLNAHIAALGFGYLPIPLPIVNILEPSDLIVRIKTPETKWREVGKIQLKLAIPAQQTPSASVS